MRIGSNSSVDSEFSLTEEVLEVVEQPYTHGVLHVHTLDAGQVTSRLSHTLADTHDAVVEESSGVAVRSVRITET